MSDRPVRRLHHWDHAQLRDLAEDFATPLYVIDLDRVRANYERIADAFGDRARVMYAAKAHTGGAVLRAVLDAGGTIECAARGELERAVSAGADRGRLQYTAVNPPAADLDYAAALGSEHPGFTVTAGARDTFDRLADRGFDGRALIRVNPAIGTGHHEKVATGADAKFGIPFDEVPDVAEAVRDRFELVGLHAHVGSGVLAEGLDEHLRAVGKVADLARSMGNLEVVDVGGGFGVPYREDEEPLDMPAVANRFVETVEPLEAELVVEPGRYVVADASLIMTRVNTVKPTPETRVVGVDASLATLIRPAMFDAYHPIRNLTEPTRRTVSASVGGPCCTSADVFCTDRSIAEPRRGDLLAIGNAGAYGYELSNNFHSQPRPAEVALDGDDIQITRRRETIEDVVRLEG